ncbi:MAG TPA: hypothetical protein ENG50_04475 [Candidatus Altiarchaeales archaeon]|nr:hypothetical protein [Candidatus Altiarchaeales archaeon]
MTNKKACNLRDRIIKEMVVDYANALERNFDLAKQFIRITRDGKIDIRFKDKLTGIEQILLYLIGKLYAKEAGFTDTESVGNKELMDELGITRGSLLPWLKSLRDHNKIKQIKKGKHTYHAIPVNLVEKTLKSIERKIKKNM